MIRCMQPTRLERCVRMPSARLAPVLAVLLLLLLLVLLVGRQPRRVEDVARLELRVVVVLATLAAAMLVATPTIFSMLSMHSRR